LGDSKGPIRLKGLFVFGTVTLALGYAVPVAGSAAGPQATLGAASAPSAVALARVDGAPPRINPNSFLVGFTLATVVELTPVDFARREVADATLAAGVRSVAQAGVAGLREQTVERVLEDGFEVDRHLVAERLTAPVEEVTRVGTRPPDPLPPPAAGNAVAPVDPNPSLLVGARAVAGSATSYCLTGRTATGSLAGPGSIAVDPSVIALGSHLFVPGYGYGWAVDTGSAIRGTLVDIWLDCDAAIRWGRRAVTIYVLAS